MEATQTRPQVSEAPLVETPKCFKNISAALAYHAEKSLPGWFIVLPRVYWTTGIGDYSLTGLRPKEALDLENVKQ